MIGFYPNIPRPRTGAPLKYKWNQHQSTKEQPFPAAEVEKKKHQ
jgi:hypothetical protein